MSSKIPTLEADRIDEPNATEGYSKVLTSVAAMRRPIIVCRQGEDLAAVVPLEHFELLQDAFARQEAEQLAAKINWHELVPKRAPVQEWFDGDEPKPF